MTEHDTAYGKLRVGARDALFARLADLMESGCAGRARPFTIGLTGGSTPKAFYEWAVRESAIGPATRRRAVWSVSDERMVPLSHPDSNFGNADRALLRPLDIPGQAKLPWPVSVDPHSAATAFQMRLHDRFGSDRAFDLCLLGMGDDGHTASIFPASPLLIIESGDHFAPVEVPDKGWRLSITPQGLAACARIVVMVTGAAKAARLAEVLRGPGGAYPIQLLAGLAARTEWLVDEAAAAALA
jgi:6-phosphogluconolactonase